MSALVVAKHDWKNDSAFTRDHIAIRMMILAMFIYCMIVTIQEKFSTQIPADHHTIVGNIRFLSGTLALTSMFLILTPQFGWLLLIVWVMFLVKVALDWRNPFYDFGMLMD